MTRARPAIIDGREGQRSFPFSGMILYDGEGDEIGGFGSGSSPNGAIMVNLLDYEKGEAVGSYRLIKPDGSSSSTIMINDPPPLGASSREAVSVDRRRIVLSNPDRDAEILMKDTQGRPRIVSLSIAMTSPGSKCSMEREGSCSARRTTEPATIQTQEVEPSPTVTVVAQQFARLL